MNGQRRPSRPRRVARLIGVTAIAALMWTSCSDSGALVVEVGSRNLDEVDSANGGPDDVGDDADNELIDDSDSRIPVGDFDDGFPLDSSKPGRSYDRFLIDAIDDIERFWADNYSKAYGGEYVELRGGVHPAYPGRDSDLPTGCQFVGNYEDVRDNAFYCDEGDFIVYDDDGLFPQFADEFGAATVAVIMAHEWGHAIQSSTRRDILYSFVTTTLELQADCFAGAWAGHVQENGLNGYRFSQSDITGALLGLIQIGDAPGSTAYDPSAHGSAFDRVSAFQDGFTGGVVSCVDYESNEPVPLQFGFTVEELSRPNPGDFPFGDEMFTAMRDDLVVFWEALVDIGEPWNAPDLLLADTRDVECATGPTISVAVGVAWCADDNTVVVSSPITKQYYDLIPGDFAVAYLIGIGYAEAVQTAIGSNLDASDRALLNDCLVGMWSGDILPFNTDPVVPDSETTPRIVLSPGDLDEAIRTALTLGDTDGERSMGTPFDKVDAFRQGVLFGFDGCFAA
jgi:predicted metalloprotease